MSKKDQQRVSAKDDDPVRKLCVRFKRDYKQLRDFKDAVTYLQLRNNGCPRKEAILFAAKNNCRVDTTKSYDGPKDHRTLQIQPVPNYMISEGWLYGQQDFNLGNCFPSRYSQTFLDPQNNQQLEDNFDEQEIKMRKEYKEMINRMKEYVKNINSKYNFSQETGDKLIEMVKKIVKGMKNELENRQYFILDGVRYYDAAEAIMKKRVLSEEEKNNLIERLNVFNNFENHQEFQNVQIIKVNDEDQNNNDETSPGKNNPQLSNNPFNQRNSILIPKSRLSIIGQIQPNIQYASQLKNLECATKLLEEFERTEGEELPNGPHSKFDRTYANQKKQRQEQMKNNLHLVREENQSGLEGQFNQQKYFYTNQENKNKNLIKEQQQKEDLQNIIFDIYKIDDDKGYSDYITQIQTCDNSNDNIIALNRTNSNNSVNPTILPNKNNTNSTMFSTNKQKINSIDTVIERNDNSELAQEQLPIKDYINMDIIKNMKERQDIFINNFRNKISTASSPYRNLSHARSTNDMMNKNRISTTSNNSFKQHHRRKSAQSEAAANLNIKQNFFSSNNSGMLLSHSVSQNLLSPNLQSLNNLSNPKNNYNYNKIQSKKIISPVSQSTAFRLTPLQSSKNLNAPSQLSQFNTENSLHKTAYPSRCQLKNNSLISDKLNLLHSHKISDSTSILPSNNNNNSSNNRTVSWMVKNQQEQQIQSQQNQASNQVNSKNNNININRYSIKHLEIEKLNKVNQELITREYNKSQNLSTKQQQYRVSGSSNTRMDSSKLQNNGK